MERRISHGRNAAQPLSALLLIALLAAPAAATQIIVTTTDDETTTDGDCSLREAFIAANSNTARDACKAGSSTSTDEIVLTSDAIYSLTIPGSDGQGLVGSLIAANNTAATDIEITVTGGGTATISQDAAPDTRVMAASVGARIDIEDVVIQGGTTSEKGGAIFIGQNGFVSLTRCTVSDNTATENGGAIFNQGTLVVDSCVLEHNVSGAAGGAIAVSSNSTTLVKNSLFVENAELSLFGGGGAIASSSTLSVLDSAFVNNRAKGIGAAVSHFNDVPGQSSIVGSSFIGNEADFSKHAVDLFSGSEVLPAANNWWGAKDGPGGAGPGHGDAIGTSIDASSPATAPNVLPLETIANGNFQNDSDGDRVPQRWTANQLNAQDGVACGASGACFVKMRGNGAVKQILQTVRLAGHAGDSLTFKARSRAHAVPGGAGKYRAQVTVFHDDGTEQDFNLDFSAGSHGFQRLTQVINPAKDYGKIRVRIEYGRSSGVVRFDSISLVANP